MPIVAQGSTSTGDLYTFSLEGFPEGILDFEPIIANALEGIEYISHILNWKGTLDFGLQYIEEDPRSEGEYGKGAVFGSLGDAIPILYEAQTGIDPFPGDIDLGSVVIGEYIRDKKMYNYGQESFVNSGLSVDHRIKVPHDQFINRKIVQEFQHTFVHEFTHSMGIAYNDGAQYEFGHPLFDEYKSLASALWSQEGDRYYFNGQKANSLSPERIEFQHGAHVYTRTKGLHDVPREYPTDYPYISSERLKLSQLEIAILEDWGWEIADRNYGDETNSLFLIEDKLWSYSDLLEREVWKDGVRYHPSEIDGVTGFFVKEPSGDRQGPGNASGSRSLTIASLQSPTDLTWVKKGDRGVVTLSPDISQVGWSWWTVFDKGNKRKEKKSFSKMLKKGHYPGNEGSVFVYRQKTGELYLDANYEQKGFGGNGGLIANRRPGTLVFGNILTF